MKLCYFLVLLSVLASSFAVAQMNPIGIAGTVYVDGIPSDNRSVLVTIDNGKSATFTTGSGGHYALTLDSSGGDTIRIDVRYNGIIFSNTTKIDHGPPPPTQWLNLSIETDKPPNGPENGQHPPPEDDEPEDPPEEPDEPNGNETEEPVQNETENGNETQYYLTVAVVDNATGDPISSASVNVYCNDSKIAKSYTNDTGVASFLLEEGDYIVEVTKEGYSGKSGGFTLLCSVDQPFSLDKKGDDNPNPQPTEDQGVPLYVYGITCAIVVIIILGIIVYWWWYR